MTENGIADSTHVPRVEGCGPRQTVSISKYKRKDVGHYYSKEETDICKSWGCPKFCSIPWWCDGKTQVRFYANCRFAIAVNHDIYCLTSRNLFSLYVFFLSFNNDSYRFSCEFQENCGITYGLTATETVKDKKYSRRRGREICKFKPGSKKVLPADSATVDSLTFDTGELWIFN